jgi:biotin carboxyl carrier protein
MTAASAGYAVTLDAATQNKLGIQAQHPMSLPVASQQYPAQVILPPQNQQSVSLSHSVTLLNWLIEPYQQIKSGQPLAHLFSSSLLEASYNWLIAHNKEQLMNQQFKREQSLFEQGLIPKKRLDIARSEAEQAQLTTRMSAQQCLYLGMSQAELVRMGQQSTPTGEFTLVAKVTGRVVKLEARQGHSINPGEPLLSYQSGDDRWIEFALPASDALQLSSGDSLTLKDTPYHATLVGQQPERNTAQKVMFLAKIDSAPNLMPGQWVSLQLNSPSLQTFEVPRQAVVHIANQASLFVLRDQSISTINVELLGSTRNGWQIRAPELTPDELIVVQGTAAVKALLETDGVTHE